MAATSWELLQAAYDAAKEWLTGKSDLSEAAKGMSIEERGAFYAAALSSAAEAGGGAAQQFMNQYGDEFKETMQSIAQSRYGLTESQAAVYAESFDTNEGRMNQAVQNLKMEYAERNPDGSPMMQGGQPVLSQQNEEFTDKLVNVLQNSTEAGDRSGSYLTAVRGVQHSKSKVLKDQPNNKGASRPPYSSPAPIWKRWSKS